MTANDGEAAESQKAGDEQAAGIAIPELVGDDDDSEPAVTSPSKLLRIAVMLREMQEEVRRAAPDEAGRERLRTVHDKAIDEMATVLSKDLRAELSELALPFDEDTPTESEILIAQAQLLGWLEGLFQGIQAAMFSQQMQARQQFEQMRQRGLPPGLMPQQGGSPEGPGMSTGQYL